jgi:hypothetical protein
VKEAAMSADPWRLLKNQVQASFLAEQWIFAPEEHARLSALRTQLRSRGIAVEMDFDEQRLLFARWLVEHGKLSDERRKAGQ